MVYICNFFCVVEAMDEVQTGEVLILNCPACRFMTLRIKSLEDHVATHPLRLTVRLYL